MNFDFKGFINSFVKNRELVGIRYYVGQIKPEENNQKSQYLHRLQQILFSKIKEAGFYIVRGKLKKSGDIYLEKGVDVRIGIDLVEGSYEDRYDTAILVTSDADLTPAIEMVTRKNRKVEVVGFHHKRVYSLMQNASVYYSLKREELRKYCPNTMYKVAVLASTRGTNFQSLIEAKKSGVLKDNVDLSCLIVNKSDCGAVEKAKSAGIPHYFVNPMGKTREEFDAEVMQILEKHQIDLVVLGGYMRIISPIMVRKYRDRIINIHPSLLPKYAGGMNLDVHKAVIDAKEKESGMTIHLINENVDEGPIVLQKVCPVLPNDTPDTLRDRVQALEKEWYPKVVQMFADEKVGVMGNKVSILNNL